MNTAFESTALRPIFSIRLTSIRERSRFDPAHVHPRIVEDSEDGSERPSNVGSSEDEARLVASRRLSVPESEADETRGVAGAVGDPARQDLEAVRKALAD